MSQEAEYSVLGGLMQDNSMLDLLSLEPDHFSTLDSKVIYKAILDLRANDLPFDVITISEHLERNNQLDYVGGFKFLAELELNTPSSRNVPAYSKIILRDWKSLQLERKGQEIIEIAKEHSDFEPKLEKALGLFDELNMEGEKDLKDIKDHVQDYARELERRLEQDGIDGLETGFRFIDNRLKGLKAGEVYIVAGRPGSGKSTYALNIANEIAKDKKAIFFSMEMPSKQVVQRSVAALGNVEINWLKEGLKNSDEGWAGATDGMDKLNKSNLIIDDNGFQTVNSIRVKCKKQGKLSLVVVDYIQLMTGNTKGNRTEEVSEISRGLKLLAKELDCPVIALSQLNRSLESRKDKRPVLSDLRESGAIEQDADVIQFIYRDEYYYDCDTNKGYSEIITAKFRDGEPGKDILATDLSRAKFKNAEHILYQPHEEKTQQRGGFGQ